MSTRSTRAQHGHTKVHKSKHAKAVRKARKKKK